MDFNFTQQQEEMRTHLESFLNKICPEEYVEKCDKDGVPPYEAYKELCDAGWLGLIIPEEYGVQAVMQSTWQFFSKKLEKDLKNWQCGYFEQ